MAMSKTDDLERVDEPVLRQIQPKPFHWVRLTSGR